jgi:hypothetical protein
VTAAYARPTPAAGGKVWKVDLNSLDDESGLTLLDYVDKELDENAGNANVPVLTDYYEVLRKAGAKHCAELPRDQTMAAGGCKPFVRRHPVSVR